MGASLFACLVALASGVCALSLDEDDHFHLEDVEEVEEGDDFTNSWVAEIRGGESVARRVARDHGFTYKGLVEPHDDYYILTRDDHPEVSTKPNNHLTGKLKGENGVIWAEQQALLKMQLRSGWYGAQPEYEEYDDENETDYEEDEEPYYPPRMENHEVMPAYAEDVDDYEDEDDYDEGEE